MRILILGAEGYLGWPTAMYLTNKGHTVGLLDNSIKRKFENEAGVRPLIDIPNLTERFDLLKSMKKDVLEYNIDVKDCGYVLHDFKPDVIVHYAEQPSAPFSMSNKEAALSTQNNNVLGTLSLLWDIKKYCPDAHLVKLGTMGEYGTPNIDIEEGYLDIEHNGRVERALFPKSPGSFYHLSKVHDSHNIYFACKMWGLRATDLNQGVVYGIKTDEMIQEKMHTSFHYDSVFGTVLNRFCAQAVCRHPLTVYGNGNQKRAFLNIRDTLRCVELACLNPSEQGEMKIYNQFTEIFSVNELAQTVSAGAAKLGIDCSIEHVDNPRIELENHYFNPIAQKLLNLGLKPKLLREELISSMLKHIEEHRENIDYSALRPNIKWKE